MFAWGFSGWGNAPEQLVKAVDVAEKRRGFNPPVFVDIRIRRSGRAEGFKERAFETLLGRRRYRWMQTLGNTNVVTGRRGEPRIACPKAAGHLLDLALDAADRSARVIFFCACESPLATSCHRHSVTKLLRREARRRGVPFTVSEWPGGAPAARPVSLRVSPESLHGVRRGAKAVPLKEKRIPADFAGIPWGTLVTLQAGRESLLTCVGPAAYRSGRWVLPIFLNAEPAADPRGLRRMSARLRRELGLENK
jgi:hypothetical protein